MLSFKTFIPETINTLHKISPTDFIWFNKAVEDFKKTEEGTHVVKCPGINNILQTGWVQKTYQDLKIMTNGDKISFKCLKIRFETCVAN